MNHTELDNAWKKWKRGNKRAYDTFLHWSKRELNKQRDIDSLGYSLPSRKHNDEPNAEQCFLNKSEGHYCDLCATECKLRHERGE